MEFTFFYIILRSSVALLSSISFFRLSYPKPLCKLNLMQGEQGFSSFLANCLQSFLMNFQSRASAADVEELIK